MEQETIEALASRLHANAIHLLRRVRREDPNAGLSPARLSVLSGLAYGGPASLAALATAEQVKAPTMTRLVQGLESAGLVVRERAAADGRSFRIAATDAGRALLESARRRRIAL